ncbi:hypothetical protein ACFXDE_17675 [Kitasatospora sp. NPDC059408]|uniref:hypothetical protein n=1 Tax=Kitasatospora sp. NPDC059408 TaxID=3346823 RepID=UPI00367AE94C
MTGDRGIHGAREVLLMLRRLAVAAVVCGAVAGMLGAAGPVEQPRSAPGSIVVIQEDPDAAVPGGTTTVHGIVANETAKTAPALVVEITMPPGAVPEEPFFPRTCNQHKSDKIWTVTCTIAAGLESERTATALVPVRIPNDASEPLTGGRVSVTSPDDPGVNDSQPFTIQVAFDEPTG